MKGEQRYCWLCGRAFLVNQDGNTPHWFCSPRHAEIERLTIKRLEQGVRLLEQTEGRVAQAWEAAAAA